MSTIEKTPITTNGPAAVTRRTEYPPAEYDYALERGAGWLLFAAFMLGLAGIFAMIAGIAAIADSSFYVAGAHFVFSGLSTWGWIITLVGLGAIFAAFGVTTGSQWARWYGIVVAGCQALAQLMFIQAYPFWSLCVFALDVLIIYALAAYGGTRKGLNA